MLAARFSVARAALRQDRGVRLMQSTAISQAQSAESSSGVMDGFYRLFGMGATPTEQDTSSSSATVSSSSSAAASSSSSAAATDAAHRTKWTFKDLERELNESKKAKDASRQLAAFQRAAEDGIKLGAYHRVGECAAVSP